MASSECVGCGVILTGDIATREHILPLWLAEELHLPGVSYKHYHHREETESDELLRSHDLRSFAIKNVCASCNNGWMSQLEGDAKPILLKLLNMEITLLQMTQDERRIVSAWAIKTVFMIASAQPEIKSLPWHLFGLLALTPRHVPEECPVVAGQQHFMDGFMHATRTDIGRSGGLPIHARIAFSIRKLHFVVVIPFVAAERVVRTTGVHLPLWPLDAEILVRYATFPTFSSPSELINYLVDAVECGIISRNTDSQAK